MSTKPRSNADLTSILERMHLDRMLMVRHGGRQEKEVVAALDDYTNERAGLADLLLEAQITLGRDQIGIAFDDSARRAAEDANLGDPLPRR